jgi:hypothetical protein
MNLTYADAFNFQPTKKNARYVMNLNFYWLLITHATVVTIREPIRQLLILSLLYLMNSNTKMLVK